MPKNLNTRLILLLLAGAALVMLVMALWFAEPIPPRNLTQGRMLGIESRVRAFYARTGTLPLSLAQLPEGPEGHDNSILDGWHRPIEYEVSEGTVKLRSLGQDGAIGGNGAASDIVHEFRLDDAR